MECMRLASRDSKGETRLSSEIQRESKINSTLPTRISE